MTEIPITTDREIELNEKEMNDYLALVEHLNSYFKINKDIPVSKIRVEWANGFGTEMRQDISHDWT